MDFVFRTVRLMLLLALGLAASAGAFAHDCGMAEMNGAAAPEALAVHAAQAHDAVPADAAPAPAKDCCGAAGADDGAPASSPMPLGCLHYCCVVPPAMAFSAGIAELPPLGFFRADAPVPELAGIRILSIFRPPEAA